MDINTFFREQGRAAKRTDEANPIVALPKAIAGRVLDVGQTAGDTVRSLASDFRAGYTGQPQPQPQPQPKLIPSATRNAVAVATEGEAIPPARWGGETNPRPAPRYQGSGGGVDFGLPRMQQDTETRAATSISAVPARNPTTINGGGFDFGLPRMQRAFNPYTPSEGAESGFSPELLDAIRAAQAASAEAFKGRGIADMWRGRQFAKQRDRLIAGAVAMRNSAAQDRSNDAAMITALARQQQVGQEIPLALMRQATDERGQDITARGQDVQMRGQDYSLDASMANVGASLLNAQRQVDAQRYGADLQYALGRPAAEQTALQTDLFNAGRVAEADLLAGLGKSKGKAVEPPPPQQTTEGGLLMFGTDGSVRPYTRLQLQELSAAQGNKPLRDARAAEELARRNRLNGGS